MTAVGILILFLIYIALLIGVFSILRRAKDYDAETAPPEPTTLLTVGALVSWKGTEYMIERFYVGQDNQTYAVLRNNRSLISVEVSELEGVRE